MPLNILIGKNQTLMKLLAPALKDTLQDESINGVSLLWLAAHTKQHKLIEKWADNKCIMDLNCAPRSRKSETVLWTLISNNQFDLSLKLLKLCATANIDAAPTDQNSIAHLAFLERQWGFVDFLQEYNNKHSEDKKCYWTNMINKDDCLKFSVKNTKEISYHLINSENQKIFSLIISLQEKTTIPVTSFWYAVYQHKFNMADLMIKIYPDLLKDIENEKNFMLEEQPLIIKYLKRIKPEEFANL